jgi:2-hydroxychromene-2-carboxylate isomerase
MIIEYFLSLSSPWTYLGSARFLAMTRAADARVVVRPAKFGEVFAKTGGLPLPKRSPQRQAYRLMELNRWRDQLGIPINVKPKHFPADEAAATRFLIAAIEQGQDGLRLSHEIGKALWEREEDLADTRVLDDAAQRAGLDGARVRSSAANDDALNAIWDRNTEDAVTRGVFGAPSYFFPDGEIFWGQDRLDFVERKLARSAP